MTRLGARESDLQETRNRLRAVCTQQGIEPPVIDSVIALYNAMFNALSCRGDEEYKVTDWLGPAAKQLYLAMEAAQVPEAYHIRHHSEFPGDDVSETLNLCGAESTSTDLPWGQADHRMRSGSLKGPRVCVTCLLAFGRYQTGTQMIDIRLTKGEKVQILHRGTYMNILRDAVPRLLRSREPVSVTGAYKYFDGECRYRGPNESGLDLLWCES